MTATADKRGRQFAIYLYCPECRRDVLARWTWDSVAYWYVGRCSKCQYRCQHLDPLDLSAERDILGRCI